jgi:histone-lysine N-methyltransferase SETMAR
MTLRHTKFEVLPHTPYYSPHLAPSDFHLFGPLKESLRGRKFNLDDDVQLAVHEWHREQPQEFFYSGIQALVSRWHKCVELQGDYAEL